MRLVKLAVVLACTAGPAFSGTLAGAGLVNVDIDPTVKVVSTVAPFTVSNVPFAGGMALSLRGDMTFRNEDPNSFFNPVIQRVLLPVVAPTGSSANAGDMLSSYYKLTMTETEGMFGDGKFLALARQSGDVNILGAVPLSTLASSNAPSPVDGFWGPETNASSTTPLQGSTSFYGFFEVRWSTKYGDTLRISITDNDAGVYWALAPMAIPEPASAALLLATAPVLCLLARRRPALPKASRFAGSAMS